MKTFYELLKLNLKIYYYYRWSFLLNTILDPLMLIIQIMVIKTIYNYNATESILGYSVTQMIWYFAAIKFFAYLVWSFPDQDISNDVMSGNLGIKLAKPLSVIKWEFSKTLAGKFCTFVFNFIPNFIIFTILIFPDFLQPVSLLKYLILTFFAFILFYLMSFLLGIVAIWWLNNRALRTIKMIFMNVAAGAVIPLDFFPGIIQSILKALPFHYLSYLPIQFFLNRPHTQGWNIFLHVLCLQLFWILIFYILCKLCWSFSLKYYTIAGG